MSTDGVPPPPDLSAAPKWLQDQKAQKEEANWDNEDALRGQRVKNDLLWLKCYGWVVVAITLAFAGLFLIGLVSWAAHYLSADKYHWLTGDQLSKIQSVLFSGGMGAVSYSYHQIGKALSRLSFAFAPLF